MFRVARGGQENPQLLSTGMLNKWVKDFGLPQVHIDEAWRLGDGVTIQALLSPYIPDLLISFSDEGLNTHEDARLADQRNAGGRHDW